MSPCLPTCHSTWKSDKDKVAEAVYHAIKTGYRHLDCAAIYGNESHVGRGIKRAIDEGLVTREQLWVTSKLWITNWQPEHVRPALEKTLADLGLQYLDLYLIHWPFRLHHDAEFPDVPEEQRLGWDAHETSKTWKAMLDARDSGLARTVGVSNFTMKKLHELLPLIPEAPEVNQCEMHPLLQQPDLLAGCTAASIHVTGYTPIGSPGSDGGPDVLDNPVLNRIAERLGLTAAAVALGWNMKRGVSVIPKSVTPERIESNLRAREAMAGLSDEDMLAISEIDEHQRVVGGTFLVKADSAAQVFDE